MVAEYRGHDGDHAGWYPGVSGHIAVDARKNLIGAGNDAAAKDDPLGTISMDQSNCPYTPDMNTVIDNLTGYGVACVGVQKEFFEVYGCGTV
jgi:hypothetical protein